MDQWTDEVITYDRRVRGRDAVLEAVETMSKQVLLLELVAPKPIASVVVAMSDWGQVINPRVIDIERATEAYHTHVGNLAEFLRLCRIDIEGAIDDRSADSWDQDW